LIKKTRGRKSRDTVPLRTDFQVFFDSKGSKILLFGLACISHNTYVDALPQGDVHGPDLPGDGGGEQDG
jgi:hypothetical protein